MPVTRLRNDPVTIPYRVSDVNHLNEGRTIVWRQQVLMPEKGALSMAALNPPNPGVPCGIDSINVQVEGGVAEITWTFRTQFDANEGGGSPGPNGKPQNEYELSGSTSQEPITSHPKYEQLFNRYAKGEKDGEPEWLLKDPDGQGASTGLSTGGGQMLSPLYGVRDYLAANAVYKEVAYYRGRNSIPPDLVSKCGKIDDPPSLKASGSLGRWLRCGASIRQMGDAYQVTTMWMASQSATNLWKAEIYG